MGGFIKKLKDRDNPSIIGSDEAWHTEYSEVDSPTAILSKEMELNLSKEGQAEHIVKQQISYQANRLAEGIDTLQINDIVFSMPREVPPPSVIRIDKQMLNFKWQTLRTTASQKVASGHGNVRISFSLYFVGVQAINTGLRRLVASFEATPFVFIENSFIRNNIVPPSVTGNGIIDSMACSLVNMVIRTEPGYPNVLVVDMDMLWFNYKPFSPDFLYRERWEVKKGLTPLAGEQQNAIPSTNSEGTSVPLNSPLPQVVGNVSKTQPTIQASAPVKFPEHSTPLVERLNYVMDKYPKINGRITNALSFIYREYRTLSSAEQAEIIASSSAYELELLGGALKEVDPNYTVKQDSTKKSYEMKLRANALELWNDMAKVFYEEFGKPIAVTSMFRTEKEQARLHMDRPAVANPPGESWHEVGLAVDVSTVAHNPGGPSMSPEEWKWLVDNGPSYGWYNRGLALAEKNNPELIGSGVGQYFHSYTVSVPASLSPSGSAEANYEEFGNKTFTERWHFDFKPGQSEAWGRYQGDADIMEGMTPATAAHKRARAVIAGVKAELAMGSDNYDLASMRMALQEALDKTVGEKVWKPDLSPCSSTYLAFYRDHSLEIAEDDPELVPTSIVISKSNIISQLPVVGYEFATQQYLGSTDMDAVITFSAVSDAKLSYLQAMVAQLQINARGSRQAREAPVVKIQNCLFNMLNFDKALIESISAESVPGSPDLYNVTLQLTQYTKTEVPELQREMLNEMNPSSDVARYFYNTFFEQVSSYVPRNVDSVNMDAAARFGRDNTFFEQVSSCVPRINMDAAARFGRDIGKFDATRSDPLANPAEFQYGVRESREASTEKRFLALGDASEYWVEVEAKQPSITKFFKAARKMEDALIDSLFDYNRWKDMKELGRITRESKTPSEEYGKKYNKNKYYPMDLDSGLLDQSQPPSEYRFIYNAWENGKMPIVWFTDSSVSTGMPFSFVGESLNNPGNDDVKRCMRHLLLIYSAVLFEIILRGGMSPEALNDLGIPAGLVNNDLSLLYSNGERPKDDPWFIGQIRQIFNDAATSLARTVIIGQPGIFAPLYVKYGWQIQKGYEGLPTYPDLYTPSHPYTGLVSHVDPDYYFFNQSTDGDLAVNNKANFFDLYDKAVRVLRKTWDSLDENTSWWAYGKDVISYNKPTFDDYKGKAKAWSSKITGLKAGMNYVAREVAAAAIHEGDAYIPSGATINKDKLKKIFNLETSAKKLATPFRWNGITSDEIDSWEKGLQIGPSDASLRAHSKEKIEPKNTEDAHLLDVLEGSYFSFNEETYRMARAFPTFKIYFIEDDTNEETRFSGTQYVRNFDDFYSYSAIKDIRVVRSRKIPADLCVITVTNINGELDILAYTRNDQDSDKTSNKIVEKFDPMQADTKAENPFSRLVVTEGSKIQIRLGYSNNPNQLEIVFNGQVVEVALAEENANMVQLVCQSYGTELVSELKGTSGQEEEYESTQELLSAMICSPEVTHFGRWSRNGRFQQGEWRAGFSDEVSEGPIDDLIRGLKEDALRKWSFLNKPQDDNIYAPDITQYGDLGDQVNSFFGRAGCSGSLGALSDSLKSNRLYHPFHVTIWDIFKEMELRHPGFVALPVPYGQRYTMYFGSPSHKYWSRPLTYLEETRLSEIDADVSRLLSWDSLMTPEYRMYSKNLHIMDAFKSGEITRVDQVEQYVRQKITDRLTRERIGYIDRYAPFQKHWVLTSDHHIIANNIRASSYGTFNAVELVYFDDPKGDDLQTAGDNKSGALGEEFYETVDSHSATMKIKADDNIEDKDTRLGREEYFSCYGDYYARRYCVGLLMRSLKEVYKGEVVILGNARIKPYDICYIYDAYSDMFGPVEVEQVTHIFSQETGFITEIKPNMIINHNDYTTQSTIDAMWSVGNEYVKGAASAIGIGATALAIGGTITTGLAGGAVGLVVALAGGYKIIEWTQMRQPIVITPLIHKHRPLIAGLENMKTDTIAMNFAGRWERFKKDVKEGWDDFWRSDPIMEYLGKFGSDWTSR